MIMSYVANVNGWIQFKNELKAGSPELNLIACHLQDAIGDNAVDLWSWHVCENSLLFGADMYYDREDLMEALEAIEKIAEIESGYVRFIGEDFNAEEGLNAGKYLWRFIYRGRWVEQTGSVVFRDDPDGTPATKNEEGTADMRRMTSPHEVSTMASISTIHLMPETLAKLQRGENDLVASYGKYENNVIHGGQSAVGAFIHVPEYIKDLVDISSDLLTVLSWARQHHYEWINCDADAAEVPELPSYTKEWDKDQDLDSVNTTPFVPKDALIVRAFPNVSQEAYDRVVRYYDGDVEEAEEAMADWPEEAIEKGYAIFERGSDRMLEVQKIDELGAFKSDDEAIAQAVKDGVKIIPVDELPEPFPWRYLGWVDTPENRSNIERFCQKLLNKSN
jgi:hypothetical protein